MILLRKRGVHASSLAFPPALAARAENRTVQAGLRPGGRLGSAGAAALPAVLQSQVDSGCSSPILSPLSRGLSAGGEERGPGRCPGGSVVAPPGCGGRRDRELPSGGLPAPGAARRRRHPHPPPPPSLPILFSLPPPPSSLPPGALCTFFSNHPRRQTLMGNLAPRWKNAGYEGITGTPEHLP